MFNSWVKFCRKVAFLAGGDTVSLLAFSAIGRFSHGFPIFDLDTVKTADPFIAGILFCRNSASLFISLVFSFYFIAADLWNCGRLVFECILSWSLYRGW